MSKVKAGENVPNDTVIQMAKLFHDEVTLSNLPQHQLVAMCKYMGLPQYGMYYRLLFMCM